MNTMMDIELNRLRPHPDNPNVMPEPLLAKLIRHIEQAGDYPALIVRPHPDEDGAYQVLDGRHRLEALRRLKRAHARCDVWDVDDDRARLLLLTLNRLQGADDPLRRARLLKELDQSMGIAALTKLIPDDAAKVKRMIELTEPPPPLAAAPALDAMPQAVTFFLTGAQKERLDRRLRAVRPNRSEALIELLQLD
jgi:ParB-like chromosome segregation protein Spo0J